MFKRWKIIDIILAAAAVITVISYFVHPGTFNVLIWIVSLAFIIRFIAVMRRRFFWKIRNRLIFASIFLVGTPIFFITVFFITAGKIVIAQYGALIIENIMQDRINRTDMIASLYLQFKTHPIMILDAAKYIRKPFFNVVFFENDNGKYKTFFKYPDSFNDKKIIVDEFKGKFLIDDKLYLGALRKDDKKAALIAIEINQESLDQFYSLPEFSLPDFKVKFRPPNPPKTAEAPPQSDDTILFQHLFDYSYLDYNTLTNSKPTEKSNYFILESDSQNIYRKINDAISRSSQGSVVKLIYLFITLGITCIIISFLIGFRMIRIITRSIDQLTKGTQRIRNGDFSFRIRTRSGDQMQYLGECFNEMAAGIDRLLLDEKEKQRLEEELRIARSIQLKLLPQGSLVTNEFEIAAVNIPAEEIAGDYFDYFYKPGNCLSLLVADVSGKGSSAAFYMAELKGVVNHLHRSIMPPASLISECHYSLKDTFDKVTFITMNIAQFRMKDKVFRMARAGHTPAVFYNSLERKCIELQPAGMAIGLINFSYEKLQEVEMSYRSGDILLLFSDGLTEIMNEEEEMLGIERLKKIIQDNHNLPAEEIKQIILDFSMEFSESVTNRDDLTFILLKVK